MNLSIVIPTLDAAATLPRTLAALGAQDDIIVVDGGSDDGTVAIARESGARLEAAPMGRGVQLQAGAEAARGDWLLFLHADTVLEPGWREAVEIFCADPANRWRAAVFRFALDDHSVQARRLERLVAWRVRWMGLPYGDQGLLISRAFYDDLGGFRLLTLMEDVDMARRIGRKRLTVLPISARTSAARWRRDGWTRRSLRNLACLALYFLGVPPHVIRRVYG
ncbi:TIGR04283 family arsenosugar biosynthesis glycosyltransferase [Methylosinus sp. Sm6]|uniref:TIGR04283 family arsenosugar biosynthesis glycosyltransferase n=1 Tax=Methylosinus sp. Sm6 TaxID=2866948 RepID=UPI001C99B458|nr:TIGR04283 family arsenosugar biosynthesis glycosyltransferase [Methylosinus sp. Sm6]MBY6243908.1 TIGR04283 family arsenosugar biosynthesis glycosyltransferase [Methylosinus sp. Sm6]